MVYKGMSAAKSSTPSLNPMFLLIHKALDALDIRLRLTEDLTHYFADSAKFAMLQSMVFRLAVS